MSVPDSSNAWIRRLGVRVALMSRHFLPQKLWHFHKIHHSCVANECCCPRTFNISNVNFTLTITKSQCVYHKYTCLWRKKQIFITDVFQKHHAIRNYTPAQRSWRGYTGFTLSVCPSARLPVWPYGGHIGFFGFRTLTLLWLWISTSNFSGTILMYMGRSLLIFSNVIFKMAAWRPY